MDQCLAAYKLQEYYTVMSSVLVCNRTPCELVAGVRRYALTQLSEHTVSVHSMFGFSCALKLIVAVMSLTFC